jgi:hypothetical protein
MSNVVAGLSTNELVVNAMGACKVAPETSRANERRLRSTTLKEWIPFIKREPSPRTKDRQPHIMRN